MLQPTVVSGGRTVPITGPAVKFARTPTRVRRPAPDSGQHTEEILDLIGATEAQRGELRRAGIIE
jgi:formyl-CoA transferase